MTRLPTGFALASAAVLATLLAAGPALAQPAAHEQVARLLRAGQPAEALRQADELLAGRPNDAQLRFLKGVAQSQSGAAQAAQDTFTALTQDYPELPEPYNNLAVLHAGAGRLEPARAALETALRLSPGYATAYQNLGDVYARLAAKAWQRALELDPANPALQPRLQVLQQLPTEAATR
jgi:Flp pilus assembly protein TadD